MTFVLLAVALFLLVALAGQAVACLAMGPDVDLEAPWDPAEPIRRRQPCLQRTCSIDHSRVRPWQDDRLRMIPTPTPGTRLDDSAGSGDPPSGDARAELRAPVPPAGGGWPPHSRSAPTT